MFVPLFKILAQTLSGETEEKYKTKQAVHAASRNFPKTKGSSQSPETSLCFIKIAKIVCLMI
jgi:hypothetical protein